MAAAARRFKGWGVTLRCAGAMFASAACITPCTPAWSAGVDGTPGLLLARSEFVQALLENRWSEVADRVWVFQYRPPESDRIIEDFKHEVLSAAAAGAGYRGEKVLDAAVHAERGMLLGAIKVRQSYADPHADPADPSADTAWHGNVFAVSKDGGATWKFNVLGCVERDTVQRLFPGFDPEGRFAD